jgi:hypothetical protein
MLRVHLAAALLSAAALSAQVNFETPVQENLQTPAGAQDFSMALNESETEIIFASTRAGGLGGWDLWQATRPDPLAPWSPPQPLTQLNSPQDDYEPSLSYNSLELYFISTRGGGPGASNLWVTQRPAPNAPFGPPQLAPGGINNGNFIDDPGLTEDGLTMYYTNGSVGGGDIFISTRPMANAPWGPGQPHPTANNATAADHSPSAVEANGSILWFASTRAGGGGGQSDMWMVHRDQNNVWSAPVPIQELNTADWESNAWRRGVTGRLWLSRFIPGGARIFICCYRVAVQIVRQCIISFVIPKIRSLWPLRIVWCRVWIVRIGVIIRIVFYDWWPGIPIWVPILSLGTGPGTLQVPGFNNVGGLELDPNVLLFLPTVLANNGLGEMAIPFPNDMNLIGTDITMQSVGFAPATTMLVWTEPGIFQIR